MKAFQVTDISKPAEVTEIDRPRPGTGEVLLEIAACGVNFADLLMANGQYQDMPALPFTLGLELAGTVIETGANVQQLSVGDRVAVFASSGGFAEFGCFHQDRCLLLPDNVPFCKAAAFPVAYGTSHLTLYHRAGIRAEDTVLVLGAAGGVGLTAVELAKLAGATVIAVARGAQKLAVAATAGADHLIDSDTDDILARVLELGGADIVYDPVGGDQFKAALRACNPEARIMAIGFASGDVPQIPANILLVKNISVMGLYWGGYRKFAPKVQVASMNFLLEALNSGKINPHISHELPLDQAPEALDLLKSRRSTGKIIVTPRPASPVV